MYRHILLTAFMLIGAAAFGQTIFRSVGPDGKVTFSDKPPLSAEPAKVSNASADAIGGAASTALPFELRQVVARYPVTLYSAPDCAPCATGRVLLNSRGVPFAERSVTTAEDAAALQRLSGESSLPVVSVGNQRIKGFSEVDWNQTLDAAGYPKSSVLPAGFRNPAVAPLVAVQKLPDAKPEASPPQTSEPASVAPTPAGPTPSNPAGISF
jgi:glutaredoxin